MDDGSTDPVKPLVDKFGYNYLRIDGPGGPARARNRGVVSRIMAIPVVAFAIFLAILTIVTMLAEHRWKGDAHDTPGETRTATTGRSDTVDSRTQMCVAVPSTARRQNNNMYGDC